MDVGNRHDIYAHGYSALRLIYLNCRQDLSNPEFINMVSLVRQVRFSNGHTSTF